MTYKEMVEYVKKMIEEGRPLHGYAREIAIEIAMEKEEKN